MRCDLCVLPNLVVWVWGVDVEFVLSCRFKPLGRQSDESEQETLDSVCGLDSISHGDISHGDRFIFSQRNQSPVPPISCLCLRRLGVSTWAIKRL